MRVMIVQRDAVSALSLTGELRRAGHVVLEPVSTATAAVSLACRERPDLALIDIDLDAENEGFHTAVVLKESGILSLFLTSLTEEARLHPDDAVGMVAKPFRPEDIVAVIGVVAEVLLGGDPEVLMNDDSQSPAIPSALELFRSH